MTLHSGTLVLCVLVSFGFGPVGYLVRRWRFPLLPLGVLVALHLALGNSDLYSRVPEDAQASLYVGLILIALASCIGVGAGRSELRERGRTDSS